MTLFRALLLKNYTRRSKKRHSWPQKIRGYLDKDKMWTILAWTLVLHADPDPLSVAGWRDHVLEARALGLHAVARAPRTQVVAQRLALAGHAHLVA
jgi:hypothetical protein